MIDILADVRLFVMQPVHIVGREDEDKSGTCHTRMPSSTLLKSWSKPFALAGLSTGNPMFIRQGGGSMKPVIQRIQEWRSVGIVGNSMPYGACSKRVATRLKMLKNLS